MSVRTFIPGTTLTTDAVAAEGDHAPRVAIPTVRTFGLVKGTEEAPVFYRVRKSGKNPGSVRKVPTLAPGTVERAQAEDWEQARDKGAKISAIADAHHVSVSTVRRALASLVLSRQVEEGAAIVSEPEVAPAPEVKKAPRARKPRTAKKAADAPAETATA